MIIDKLLLAGFIYETVYNLVFHPLAKIPGPKLAAFSDIPYSIWLHGGRVPYKILELHQRYGPIVRIAPNELSFNSSQSWKDIYGFRPGHKTFVKSEFYSGGSFASKGVESIVSERDVDEHAHMRRYLSSAFSEKSVVEQEALVSETVDKFIEAAGRRGSKPGGYDIAKALEMMTFDIIGELAFGETFGGVDKDEPHPWISITLGALTQGALVDTFKRFPTFGKLVRLVFHAKIKKLTEETLRNEQMAIDLVNRRITRGISRKDFMTRILEQRDPEKVSDLQIAAHASDFVIAGSDTTATALACIVYYLLHNPGIMRKLQNELRDKFTSYVDIDSSSTSSLPYLKAVILEGLRIYPPLPMGLPRVVPETGDTIDGIFIPGNTIVSTNPVAACLDERNFADPLCFRPERWLGANDKDVLDASRPFSLGPRACIGRKMLKKRADAGSLAGVELHTTLAKLIWRYDLEMADDSLDWHRDSRMLTMWKKPELHVRVYERDGSST